MQHLGQRGGVGHPDQGGAALFTLDDDAAAGDGRVQCRCHAVDLADLIGDGLAQCAALGDHIDAVVRVERVVHRLLGAGGTGPDA